MTDPDETHQCDGSVPNLAESLRPRAAGRWGKGTALVPESLNGLPWVVPALWSAAAVGWVVIALGLYRGLSGFTRRVALIAHVMTAPGVVLGLATLGFGSLYATIALTAEWWALIVVTGLRPERLVVSGSLPRLAGWSALTAVAVLGGTRLVLSG